MEDDRFDALAKRFASPVTRRNVIKAAAASAFGGILLRLDGGKASAAVCGALGTTCTSPGQCCTGICRAGKCACQLGQSPCPLPGGACSICCPDGLTCNVDRGGCVCPANGINCGTTPSGIPNCCPPDRPVCDPTSNCLCCPSKQHCAPIPHTKPQKFDCVCDSNGEKPCAGNGCCPHGLHCGKTAAGGMTCLCADNKPPCSTTSEGAPICCRTDEICTAIAGTTQHVCLCKSNGKARCANDLCCPKGQHCLNGSGKSATCVCDSNDSSPCGPKGTCCPHTQICVGAPPNDHCGCAPGREPCKDPTTGKPTCCPAGCACGKTTGGQTNGGKPVCARAPSCSGPNTQLCDKDTDCGAGRVCLAMKCPGTTKKGACVTPNVCT